MSFLKVASFVGLLPVLAHAVSHIFISIGLLVLAHWAERDYGLSAGQHAVLPEGKGLLV